MHRYWQSDGRIAPANARNNPPTSGAEEREGRRPAKGKAEEQPTSRTQDRNDGVTELLERLRPAVHRDRTAKRTARYHHSYKVDYLREAYFNLKRTAAPGVDGQSWQDYGQNLEGNLQALSLRLRQGAYQASAVRRVYVPKPDGRQRPIGIPALEDKRVQWVTAQVCATIWEAEFVGFSYGFRPERNPHNALDALTVGIQRKRVNWVLSAASRAFFDTLAHEWLVRFIQHRIGDRRVVSRIEQGLQAGVLEDGTWTPSEAGAPQGGLISPIVANRYCMLQ